MSELINKMLNNLPFALIVLGIVTFISGAAEQINIGVFLLQITNPNTKILVQIIGLGLSITGLIFIILELSKNYRQIPHLEMGSAGKFYTFSGMNEETREDDIFQDFEMTRDKAGGNINAVYYLWADTLKKGSINASVNTDSNFLKISFANPEECLASNIAIRSKCEKALRNRFNRSYLAFEARISPDSPAGQLKDVSIAIRIVNGALQHWKYVYGDNHFILSRVTGSDWQPFFISLEPHNWALFGSDGNHLFGPKTPDFNIIPFIVFELGSYSVQGPGPGTGSIDIRRIRLTAEKS